MRDSKQALNTLKHMTSVESRHRHSLYYSRHTKVYKCLCECYFRKNTGNTPTINSNRTHSIRHWEILYACATVDVVSVIFTTSKQGQKYCVFCAVYVCVRACLKHKTQHFSCSIKAQKIHVEKMPFENNSKAFASCPIGCFTEMRAFHTAVSIFSRHLCDIKMVTDTHTFLHI